MLSLCSYVLTRWTEWICRVEIRKHHPLCSHLVQIWGLLGWVTKHTKVTPAHLHVGGWGVGGGGRDKQHIFWQDIITRQCPAYWHLNTYHIHIHLQYSTVVWWHSQDDPKNTTCFSFSFTYYLVGWNQYSYRGYCQCLARPWTGLPNSRLCTMRLAYKYNPTTEIRVMTS